MDVVRVGGDAAPDRAAAEDAAWFYAHAGARFGPVSEDGMRQLVANGAIHGQTLVWRIGMRDWHPVHQTELASLVSGSGPATPPPLPVNTVNNALVWIVAFVPVIVSYLGPVLAVLLGTTVVSPWYLVPLLNICLCLADEANLKRAGYDTRWMGVWAVLLPPVYLFVRAARLKQGRGYAIVWLVTFFLSILPLIVIANWKLTDAGGYRGRTSPIRQGYRDPLPGIASRERLLA
jgi:hypothetical protein